MDKITGEIIVKQARTWIGTSFKHQGRSKLTSDGAPGACDCIGLLVGIAHELGLRSDLHGQGEPVLLHKLDETNYSEYPDGKRLKQTLDTYLDKIDKSDLGLGDILLIHFLGNPQHVAIVSDGDGEILNMIHCWAGPDKVVEHPISGYWKKSIIAVYRFKGIVIEELDT